MAKQTKFTKSARGEDCQIRLPGCNGGGETTVLCHLPDGSGTGKVGGKSKDVHSTYGCYSCHQIIDGHKPRPTGYSREGVLLAAYAGQQRTLQLFIDKGLLGT